ncbi:MAG TPA: hypothetical protein VGM75_37790 [Pseudonocardiaceae bacterium]
MQAAKQAVENDLSSLDPNGNPADQNVHVGLGAIDTTTGGVARFYGGPDYLKQGFDDASQAAGPIGSDLSIALADGVSARSGRPARERSASSATPRHCGRTGRWPVASTGRRSGPGRWRTSSG